MKISGNKQTTFKNENLKNTSSFPCVPTRSRNFDKVRKIQFLNLSLFLLLITYFPGNVFVRTAHQQMRNFKDRNEHKDIVGKALER